MQRAAWLRAGGYPTSKKRFMNTRESTLKILMMLAQQMTQTVKSAHQELENSSLALRSQRTLNGVFLQKQRIK